MTCGCGGGSCSPPCSPCSNGCAPSAPFYNQAGAVQENHDCPVVIENLVAALSAGNDFIMPACGAEAVVTFYNLTRLQVGCCLWNSTFGYLRVAAFNNLTGETHLINDCQSGNATPGTFIPHCTMFSVVAPPGLLSGYDFVLPPGPPPFLPGEPFALDVVSIVGNVITLAWHSVAIVP